MLPIVADREYFLSPHRRNFFRKTRGKLTVDCFRHFPSPHHEDLFYCFAFQITLSTTKVRGSWWFRARYRFDAVCLLRPYILACTFSSISVMILLWLSLYSRKTPPWLTSFARNSTFARADPNSQLYSISPLEPGASPVDLLSNCRHYM
jgi:hypothetical protein